MEDIVKYGLLGLGAYLVYEYMFPSTSAVTAAPAQTTSAPVTGSTVAASAPATATPQMITLYTLQQTGPTPIQLAAKNGLGGNIPLPASGLFNSSQWNYYMTTVTGIPSPDLSAYLPDGAQLMPIGTYWAALMQWAQAQASPALSGLSGLGQPGRGQSSTNPNAAFFPPSDSQNGRFDFAEMGWGN